MIKHLNSVSLLYNRCFKIWQPVKGGARTNKRKRRQVVKYHVTVDCYCLTSVCMNLSLF